MGDYTHVGKSVTETYMYMYKQFLEQEAGLWVVLVLTVLVVVKVFHP